MSKAKFEDISGQTFNWLTAVRLDRWRPGKGFYWWWKCNCGIEKSIRLVYVTSGKIKSCGCKRTNPKLKLPPSCGICGDVSDRRTAQGGYSKTCKKCYIKQKNHTSKPPVYLLNRARTRAKSLGLAFAITLDDIVIPEYCPILGIKLAYGGIKERDSSPSLDKIIPELGYVPGNIAVISHLANRIKNSGSAEQHRLIADWMDAQTVPELVEAA